MRATKAFAKWASIAGGVGVGALVYYWFSPLSSPVVKASGPSGFLFSIAPWTHLITFLPPAGAAIVDVSVPTTPVRGSGPMASVQAPKSGEVVVQWTDKAGAKWSSYLTVNGADASTWVTREAGSAASS
jgi:hypothetical protein